MSYGYKGNGGVIGYKNSWTATQSGVWDTSVRYANQVPVPTSPVSAGWYTPLAANSTNTTTQASPVNVYYRRSFLAFVVSAAEMQAVASGDFGTITQLRITNITSAPLSSRMPLPNYAIAMCHHSGANPSSSTGRTNFTTVLNQTSINFNATGAFAYPTNDTNFVWNGTDNIGVIMAWGQCPVNWNSSGQCSTRNTGNMYYARTDAAGTYVVTGTSSSAYTFRPCLDFYFSGS